MAAERERGRERERGQREMKLAGSEGRHRRRTRRPATTGVPGCRRPVRRVARERERPMGDRMREAKEESRSRSGSHGIYLVFRIQIRSE